MHKCKKTIFIHRQHGYHLSMHTNGHLLEVVSEFSNVVVVYIANKPKQFYILMTLQWKFQTSTCNITNKYSKYLAIKIFENYRKLYNIGDPKIWLSNVKGYP